MRGTNRFKPSINMQTIDKNGYSPDLSVLNRPGYWKHSGNQKLYELLGFTFLWIEEWGIRYRAVGEEVEHEQPAKRFFGDREGQPRFTFVTYSEAIIPADFSAYMSTGENRDSRYAEIYSQYKKIETYEDDGPPKRENRFFRWLRSLKEYFA